MDLEPKSLVVLMDKPIVMGIIDATNEDTFYIVFHGIDLGVIDS